MSSRTTGSTTKSVASSQLSKDDIRKMLVHEQTFYTAKSKILLASNTEASWLNSVKSLFISTLKIERYNELIDSSGSPTTMRSLNSLNDLDVELVVPSDVHLSISMPIVWYETRRTLPKALQSTTNTFMFFTANYGNCKISASNCHVLDQQKMHVLEFKLVLNNPDREKYVNLTLWTRQFNYSDYKRNNGAHKKEHSASFGAGDHRVFKKNFCKYGSVLLRIKDIVTDRVSGLNLSLENFDKLSVSNKILEQYMGTNSVFSLAASIVAKNISYNDRFYGISLPDYEKTLNIKTACIGLDQGKICVYENPYIGEHFMSIKIERDSTNKFIKVVPVKEGQNEHDPNLPRTVKIKDSSSKLVINFRNTQHVNDFLKQIEEYNEITGYWKTENISSTQKFDVRLILADIESLSTSYFEHIDRTTSIFNMKKNFANE